MILPIVSFEHTGEAPPNGESPSGSHLATKPSEDVALEVLVVEDNPKDTELILLALRHGGYKPHCLNVETLETFEEALSAQAWDVILCDYTLPDFNGLQAIKMIRQVHALEVPVIFVTGTVGEEAAAEMMRLGAQDFVNKNCLSRLAGAINRELHAAIEHREKLETLKTLEFEQNLLRQLMDNIPDAVYFKDRNYRFIRLNERKRAILQLTADDVAVGKTLDELELSELSKLHNEEEEEIFATADTVVDRIEKRTQADGSERWYSVSKAPIFDQNRELSGLVGITRDITERKMIERLKDEFVATVNHELRTPLHSIVGSISILSTGRMGDLSEPAQSMLKIAKENGDRLTALINDILEIHSAEAGGLTFDMKPLELRALVARAIDGHVSFARAYGVTIRLDDAADDGLVLADSGRLTQAIVNLLSNASKFSPRGGEVLVTIKKGDDSTCVSVRDHGPGIPEEYKKRIFEKFVQVQATDARSRGGSGLGLSITKQLVERLGGTIHFEDAPGGGTVFGIVLPTLAQVDEAVAS